MMEPATVFHGIVPCDAPFKVRNFNDLSCAPTERRTNITSYIYRHIVPTGRNQTSEHKYSLHCDNFTSTKNLQPSTFNLQPSTFNLQPSTFNLQPSTFNLQPSTRNFRVSEHHPPSTIHHPPANRLVERRHHRRFRRRWPYGHRRFQLGPQYQ